MICHLYQEPAYYIFSEALSSLFYYAHIPVTLVALGVGIFVLASGPRTLLNQLLFVLAGCFALWTSANMIVWTNIHSDVMLFVWSLFGIFSGLIALFSIYFAHVFLTGRDATLPMKTFFLALLAPLLILAPTSWNLAGFDIVACDAFAFEGYALTAYYTALGFVAMVWIFVMLVRAYGSIPSETRTKAILVGTGIESFLALFFTFDYIASSLTKAGLLPDSEIELYGLFGMAIFIVSIGMLIVRFRAFNIKLFATQALTITLSILTGSQIFFVEGLTNQLLVVLTLGLVSVAGWLLWKSVKKEIELRETIEKQEQELEQINAQQVNLLHFISHEVKGNLNKAQGVFAGMLEGDYGQLPSELSSIAKAGLDDVRGGIAMVMDILDASNLRKGSVSYDKQPFDIRHTVLATTDAVRNVAMARGLQVEVIAPPSGELVIQGDEAKLEKHVIRNLVDNAIHYTQEGYVRVSIHRTGYKVRFAVEDSGVGITSEDMTHLFTEGGKGKDSTKVNVNSTGYGLFIAKQVVEAHGGTIHAESEGAGKGSRFVVELPLAEN